MRRQRESNFLAAGPAIHLRHCLKRVYFIATEMVSDELNVSCVSTCSSVTGVDSVRIRMSTPGYKLYIGATGVKVLW